MMSEMRRGVRLPAETRRGASRPVPIDLPHPQAALACSLPALRLGLGSRRAQEAFFSCSLSQPGAGFPTPPIPASPAASHPALSEQGAAPVAALVRALLSSALHPKRLVGSWLN